MPAPLDFYFDFSSPYGYLASRRIDALAAAHGREVNWRPILLGALRRHGLRHSPSRCGVGSGTRRTQLVGRGWRALQPACHDRIR